MLKKDSDRLKRIQKALIAREYQDLPLEQPIVAAQELPRNPPSPPNKVYGRLFYSGILASLLIVAVVLI